MDASLQKALRKDNWGERIHMQRPKCCLISKDGYCTLGRFDIVIWCLSSRCQRFWALYPSSIFQNSFGGYGFPLVSWDFFVDLLVFSSFFHWAQFLGTWGEDMSYKLMELAAVARTVISRCKNTLEWDCFYWVTAVMQCTVSIFTPVLSTRHKLAGIQNLRHERHVGSFVQSLVLKDV